MAAKANTATAVPTFDFTPSFDISVPADLPKRDAANALPFKQMFADVEERALKGEQPHYFIPNAWWVKVREADPAKVAKAGYAKEKVRNQFNAWVKADPKKREPLKLIALDRTGKEGIKGIEEPGLSFWLTAPKAA